MTALSERPAAPSLAASASAVATVRAVARTARARRRRVVAGLVVLVAGLFLVDVTLRSFTVSLPDLVRVLRGEVIPGASFVVREDTLPRAVVGLLAGTAFGVSGATFQSLLRNPLASPDIIGVSAGAGAAAVLAISLGATGSRVSLAALGGACAVGLGMHLLSRSDRSGGGRLVLVGIGAAAALYAVTSFLLTRTDLQTASQSLVWITGSLSASTWDRAVPLAVALAVLLPLAGVLGRALRVLGTGDDTAAGLGVPVARARALVLLVAVVLAGVATAAAGPVAYVAFLSGPIARRLLGGAVSLPVAGLVGAAVVLGADWVAAHVVPGTALPVGVVTGALGAPFLLWLLVAGRTDRGA